MTAMSGASKSARDMLDELELEYNRSRQYGITQEITEVSAGSKAQKKKKIS
jgi:F-type H+-transporting ATPase subunit gamma